MDEINALHSSMHTPRDFIISLSIMDLSLTPSPTTPCQQCPVCSCLENEWKELACDKLDSSLRLPSIAKVTAGDRKRVDTGAWRYH